MSGVGGGGGGQPARAPRDARTPRDARAPFHEGNARGRLPSAEASTPARRPGRHIVVQANSPTPGSLGRTAASSSTGRSPVGTNLRPDQTEEDKIQAMMKQVESTLERQRQEVDEKLRGMKKELADQAAQLRMLREGLDRRSYSGGDRKEGGHDAGPVSKPAGQTALQTEPEMRSSVTSNAVSSVPTQTQRAVQITPEMLDSGDVYTINESVWDTMIFWGHDALGPLNSAILGMSYLGNIALQALFVYMVHTLMMEEEMSPGILDGLLKFRLSLAHSVDYADKVTQRSMASQICKRERKLHLAGQQFDLFGDLNDFVENGAWGICLVWFIQLLWLCTILSDIDNTYSICAATMKTKKGQKTRLALADLRDEDAEETFAPRLDSQERHEPGAAGVVDDDFHNPGEELGGFMCVVRLITMNTSRKALVQVCVCVPKLALAITLYIIGAAWLANTINFSDLILNGVALAFVLEFDEVLYSVVVPRRVKTLISNLEPIPLRPRSPGTRWSGVQNIGVLLLCAPILYWVYHAYLQKRWWQMEQGFDIVCSGELDFIYTVNPATGMVHFATTTGEDSYTDTEAIIAQVAKPPLEDHEWWDGMVSSAIFEASASDFDRAVKEMGSDSFEQIVQMSVWSTAEAAATLPCQDLASGQSANASVKALQVLMQDFTITGCGDIPRHQCASLYNVELRAICPRHCRCGETLLSNVGFFQRPEFGCPSQCETFKAVKNEIEFRFELMKVSTDSSRRLQSRSAPRPNETLSTSTPPQSEPPNETSSTPTPPQSEPSTTSLLFSSTSVLGCSDLASTDFGFAGGCADSNGESQLDKNGDDCSVYAANPWKCGHADDDDFLAAELCCSCGGGHSDVRSSLDCYDNFDEQCWLMPDKALRWLLYVKGLFEYSQSNLGFRDSVTSVVEENYAGIAPDEQTQEDLIEYIASGQMGRALANGSWDLMPGLAHPRGLSGCDYLSSYEIRSLLNIDLCAEGVHTPIRFFCPSVCGCGSSNGLAECPAACVFTECLDGSRNETCGHVHPWYSTECIAGFHNDGGLPTCIQCLDGETRRRRSTDCTQCADGFYDAGNFDDCVRCSDGATRRRRSTSCTDCDPGTYDVGESDDCTECVGGTTTRRRSTSCTDCADGSWDSGAGDDCVPALGCSTTRRRSSTCTECPSGKYNDGTTDECVPCEGGETRRRRDAVACTPCPAGTLDEGDYDDCVSVACPAYSSGEDGVAHGCTCNAGYAGIIRASSEEPYYTGACRNLSFHQITSGFCSVPILDPELCSYAARALLLTDSAAVTEDESNAAPYGCSLSMLSYTANVATSSQYPCPGWGYHTPCICLGTGDEFTCADTAQAAANKDCPDYFDSAYCSKQEGLECCGCKGGGVYTKQVDRMCEDTHRGAVSDAQAYDIFDGCLKWDWFPDTCQWASYYDDDDFTAADMCCACGGGVFTTTATSSSSTTPHTTTGSSTTEHSTTATSRTAFASGQPRMALGSSHTVLVADDGTVWLAGEGIGSTFVQLSGGGWDATWASVYAGESHFAVLSEDGALSTVGSNEDGKLGNGGYDEDGDISQVLSGVQAVALGLSLTAALKQDGTLWTAGYSIVGDDAGSTRVTFVQVSSAGSYVTGLQAVAMGEAHIAVLDENGSVWTASADGEGYLYGQLGDGGTYWRNTFVEVLADAQSVSLGRVHSAVLKADGTVWTCGDGGQGQLGDGDREYKSRATFQQVMSNAQAVELGRYTTAVLQSNGTVWVAGGNHGGTLGIGDNSDRDTFVAVPLVSSAQAIARGCMNEHMAILLEDGSVWTTGQNWGGQLGNGQEDEWSVNTFTEVFNMGSGNIDARATPA